MEFVIVLTVCSDLKTVKLEGFKNLNYEMQQQRDNWRVYDEDTFLKQRLSNKEFSLSGSRGTGRAHKRWYTLNDAIKLTYTVCIWIMPLTFDVVKGKWFVVFSFCLHGFYQHSSSSSNLLQSNDANNRVSLTGAAQHSSHHYLKSWHQPFSGRSHLSLSSIGCNISPPTKKVKNRLTS